jgi:hypothetical protein
MPDTISWAKPLDSGRERWHLGTESKRVRDLSEVEVRGAACMAVAGRLPKSERR